jgi:hypothetical protein
VHIRGDQRIMGIAPDGESGALSSSSTTEKQWEEIGLDPQTLLVGVFYDFISFL